jgi:hypothetical protein
MKTGRDVTGENIGINEKYEDMIPNYFGGDYIKQIILKNATESPRNFKMEIKSRRRFEEFGNLENYYLQKSRKNKYSKLINRIVEPGSADTVLIYYAGLYQDFQYNFNDRYILAYGSQGINAGKVKSFDENSYYGMKYYGEPEEVKGAFDIRIFNQRINY